MNLASPQENILPPVTLVKHLKEVVMVFLAM